MPSSWRCQNCGTTSLPGYKGLVHIAEHGPISRKEYCEFTGISHMTAYRDLNELVESGLLKTIGAGRYVRYVLVEEK
ncbi:MAG: DeoR family transcriptional regulator [Chloroflexota bacterium]